MNENKVLKTQPTSISPCALELAKSYIGMMLKSGDGASQVCRDEASQKYRENTEAIEACSWENQYNTKLAFAMNQDAQEGKDTDEHLYKMSEEILRECVKVSTDCAKQMSYVSGEHT